MDDRDTDLLGAIATHARAAIRYAAEQGPRWTDDEKTVDAVTKRVEQAGELAKRVSPEALATMPAVDWRAAKAFREVLVHDYEDLDTAILSEVVEQRLPILVKAIERARSMKGP